MVSQRIAIVFGCVLAAVLLSGCEQALFPKDMPRSPYERYLTLRGKDAPANQADAYGGSEPALRERLRPMGQN